VLQAFTKVTHLEPDHGEAWTNLAALWLQQGGWKEALQASEQAVKYKRDSWQTWDNYATAAAKAGVMSGCVRALTQVRHCGCSLGLLLMLTEGVGVSCFSD
jgi:tetratricopeptide (TPR) repeat protein